MPWTRWRESSVARGVPFGAPRRRGGRQSSRPQPGAGAGADLDSEVRGREGAGSCSESLCPPDGASAPAEPLCSSLAPSPASQDQDDGRGIHRPAGRWPEPSAWVHGASEPAGPALCPTPGRGRRSATPGGRLFLPGRARCPVLGVGPLTEGGGFLAWLESPLWPRDSDLDIFVHSCLDLSDTGKTLDLNCHNLSLSTRAPLIAQLIYYLETKQKTPYNSHYPHPQNTAPRKSSLYS